MVGTLKDRPIAFVAASRRRATTGALLVLGIGGSALFVLLLMLGFLVAGWAWSALVALLYVGAVFALRLLWWISIPVAVVWSLRPLSALRRTTTPRAIIAKEVGWRCLATVMGFALAAMLTNNVPATITDVIPDHVTTALVWVGAIVIFTPILFVIIRATSLSIVSTIRRIKS